jgi:hypothetical protein
MVPQRRRDDIPVLWDDLDYDEGSTRIVLADKFSGVFTSAQPREEELSATDFETVRIPNSESDAARAFAKLLHEDHVETISRPAVRQKVTRFPPPPRIATPPMTPATPYLRVVPRPMSSAPPPMPFLAPEFCPRVDPLGATDLALPITPAPAPAPKKTKQRRSLIPWATLLMAIVVTGGLFSDAVKAGHFKRAVDFAAGLVDPALSSH